MSEQAPFRDGGDSTGLTSLSLNSETGADYVPAWEDVAPPPQAPKGNLFKEVNKLRTSRAEQVDEKAKYSDNFFGRLAGNGKFEGLTFFFIGVNSLYIGADADYSARSGKPDDLYDPDTPFIFKFMENVFCTYFTGELVIRFIGYKRKRTCFSDRWFVFDSILVTMMVAETWIFPMFGMAGQLSQFSILRLLRLLRISRMARLMKKIPELMIIIKGLIASFRSVGCTAILQVLIIYVWSILFVSTYHENNMGSADDREESLYFGTMGKSMFTLFIMGTVLDDVTASTNVIRGTDNIFMLLLFILFILISSFTILNMLIGILCEVVSATAESEKTKGAEGCVKEAITSLFTTMDADGSGNITEEEFMHMKDDPAVLTALSEMDIYETHFSRFCEILFGRGKESGKAPSITHDELITMILRLSPGNHINALDFSLLQASIDRTQESLRERVLKVHELIVSAQNGKKASDTANDVTDGPYMMASMADARQGEVAPAAPGVAPSNTVEYTMDMFKDYTSHQIIQELTSRLGVPGSDAAALVAQLDRSRQSPAQTQTKQDRPSEEAFHSLGVPEEHLA